jgi:hypothetical protein
MNLLVSVLSKIGTILVTKLASWFWQVLSIFIAKKEFEKKVDGQISELKDAVNDAKKDGVISDDEEKKIRDASRNLIDGTFNDKM